MAKFLIIRFSSIGDIVLTTPVMRCLRKKYPEADIHFLTKSNFRAIADSNPYINKVHTLSEPFEEMLAQLKEEHFDYIIDLHHNLRTLRIKRALKHVKQFSFDKLNIQKFIYTNLKINLLPKKHIADRYIETLQSLQVSNDGMGLDYFIPQQDIVAKSDLPFSHINGYIIIVIGATYTTKKLPVQQLIKLCAAIKHPIILAGGKEDKAVGEIIAATDDIKIYNAAGKFNLNQSADLVRNAKVVITHDTGLMHIAAAFKKPIIAVWGNTVPAFGMYPYYGENSSQRFYNSEVQHLWCRPCSKIGYKKCPLGHFKCMEKNDVLEIANITRQILLK